MLYTFTTASDATRLKRSFKESVRAKVVAVSSAVSTLGGMVVGTAMPVLIDIFENQPHGWTIITTIFAVPCMIAGVLRFLLLKEIDVVEEEKSEKQQNKVPFTVAVKALFQNKYVFMLGLALLMVAINNATGSSTGNYYFKFVFGNVAAAAVPSLIGSLALLLIVFMPKVLERFGTRKLMMVSFFIFAVASLCKLIMPTNLIWLTICSVVMSMGTLYGSSVKNIALIECMEYGKKKTCVEMEAIYSSVIGVADKLGLGIGSFVVGIILQLGGYDGALEIQSQSALNAITLANIGLPVILGIIAFFAVIRYRPKEAMGK